MNYDEALHIIKNLDREGGIASSRQKRVDTLTAMLFLYQHRDDAPEATMVGELDKMIRTWVGTAGMHDGEIDEAVTVSGYTPPTGTRMVSGHELPDPDPLDMGMYERAMNSPALSIRRTGVMMDVVMQLCMYWTRAGHRVDLRTEPWVDRKAGERVMAAEVRLDTGDDTVDILTVYLKNAGDRCHHHQPVEICPMRFDHPVWDEIAQRILYSFDSDGPASGDAVVSEGGMYAHHDN